MGTLSERIKSLEDKFSTNEKIADTLCETAEKAVKMQSMLAGTFTKLLTTNDDIKKAVTDLINKTDRDFIALTIKRFGMAIYTIIVAAIAALVGALIRGHV